MQALRQTTIPSLVRVKSEVLERVGLYVRHRNFNSVVLLYSEDLFPALLARRSTSLAAENIQAVQTLAINSASFERATEIFRQLPSHTMAIIGFGGGKAFGRPSRQNRSPGWNGSKPCGRPRRSKPPFTPSCPPAIACPRLKIFSLPTCICKSALSTKT